MFGDHDAMLRSWRENAARDDDANFRFLRSLKMVPNPRRIDSLARELHESIFASIDCTRCANCCKTMRPSFTNEDIERIAKHLGMSPEAFVAAHLEIDPEEGHHRTKAAPCPFLGGDDHCSIYAVRPQACREYPHTDKKWFTSRTYLHAENALVCPAVYHIVKGLQRRFGRRPKKWRG